MGYWNIGGISVSVDSAGSNFSIEGWSWCTTFFLVSRLLIRLLLVLMVCLTTPSIPDPPLRQSKIVCGIESYIECFFTKGKAGVLLGPSPSRAKQPRQGMWCLWSMGAHRGQKERQVHLHKTQEQRSGETIKVVWCPQGNLEAKLFQSGELLLIIIGPQSKMCKGRNRNGWI